MKAYGACISIILLPILIGCSARNEAPMLQFLDLQTEDAELEAHKHSVRLVAQIYALDRDMIFLFGDLATPAASIRSLLLLSENGGRNWREVMTPVIGSQVIRLTFLDNRTGWALVERTVEDPGQLSLYATRDFGRSWQKVSNIPKRHYRGQVTDLGFLDANNGRMEILYEGGVPTDGFAVMITSNGGVTWKEVRILSLDEYKNRPEKDREPEESSVDYVTARDGSQWRLERQPDEMIDVLRRLSRERDWSVRSTIPAHLQYPNGRVVAPHESEQKSQ